MNRIFIALCFSIFVSAANAQLADAQAWAVDNAKSKIEFTGKQLGSSFTGSFSAYSIDIGFDPENLAASHIVATIDLASARTGSREIDDGLPTSDWFDVKKHPKAVFRSETISAKADGSYEAAGALSLRGVDKPLTLPFTVTIDGGKAVADATTNLVRTDYGVGQGDFESDEYVAFDVGVKIHIEAARKP